MFKNKPITLLIAAGLMILLVAVAGIYPLISTNTPGGFAGGRPGANMPGGAREFPQDGNFTPGGNPPSGMTPPDGTFQQGGGQMQRGNFNGTIPIRQFNFGQSDAVAARDPTSWSSPHHPVGSIVNNRHSFGQKMGTQNLNNYCGARHSLNGHLHVFIHVRMGIGDQDRHSSH